MSYVAKDEDLTKMARQYVQDNVFKNRLPNMTARSFTLWVNDNLFPNSTPMLGAPQKVSMEIANKWLNFEVKRITKGIYYNGHERVEVVEVCELLDDDDLLGFPHESNAPNQQIAEFFQK